MKHEKTPILYEHGSSYPHGDRDESIPGADPFVSGKMGPQSYLVLNRAMVSFSGVLGQSGPGIDQPYATIYPRHSMGLPYMPISWGG